MSNKVKKANKVNKTKKAKKAKKGQKVNVHYVGTLDDGTEFDSSRTRGDTLSVEIGSGQLIPGFDEALNGMAIGEVKKVSLTPEEAYGEINSRAYEKVPRQAFPENMDLQVGGMVRGNSPTGQPVVAKIESMDEEGVILNMNHPLAGKSLNFEIELMSIDQ